MPNKTRTKDTRTYRDRAEYLSNATTKRRRRIKQFAIDYRGGKCMVCGYSRCVGALDLHHIGNKKFNFSTDAYLHDWKTIKKELDKCVLLCSNCHRELHNGVIELPAKLLI